MKKVFFFLILCFLFLSCKKNSGEAKVVLEIYNVEKNTTLKVCAEKIADRVDAFWKCYRDEINISCKGNQVELSFPYFRGDSMSAETFNHLLNFNNDIMHFMETCTNEEVNDKLIVANKIIKIKLGDSLIEQYILQEKGEIKKDIFGRDSIQRKTRDSVLKLHPLSIYMMPNADNNGYLINSSVVGYAKAKDTARINSFFSLPELRRLTTRGIDFSWSASPDSRGDVPVYELYFLKQPRNGPVLSGKNIISAKQGFTTGGSPNINLVFDATGTQRWREITEKLVANKLKNGKTGSIAMVMDNKVYSAPTVNGIITDGRCEISGGFTVAQCMELAAKIKSPLNFSSKIISVELTPAK